MDTKSLKSERLSKHRLNADSGDFELFKKQANRETRIEEWPFAQEVIKNIPIYDASSLAKIALDPIERNLLLAEFAEAFSNGPGVIAIKQAIGDHDVIDKATKIFDQIITEQQTSQHAGGGDHFAKPGANDRIWNAVEKHCLADPENFARYFANHGIALPCEAWLGPNYQITAQINRVNPGGQSQQPHRDYHLGFMQSSQMVQYPTHVHLLSPVLTLQGAIAHCNMPIESGPTQLLPFSQSYPQGYVAFTRPEFQEYFAEHYVQLTLEKGDAVFFNPALMHAAGDNTSKDIFRMANLLQISSAFGHAMEAINHNEMVKALYPKLVMLKKEKILDEQELNNVIYAGAFGYPFPTNLDTDPPIGGLAPKSQVELMQESLNSNLSSKEFDALISEQNKRREA